MLNAFRNKKTSLLTWILMGMLIVGLAGFGIGVSGGLGAGDVARVGDQDIRTDDYVRALEQELRAVSGQLGRPLPMSEARTYGIDGMVLARLANDAALDGEAARLGLSTGDAAVGEQVMATPAFQAVDGSFDRTAYVLTLERAGLTPAGFEELVRREATRELLASGVQSATELPDGAALTVLGYVGERRGFDWIRLGPEQLAEPVPAPGEAEILAEYEAHPDRYTRPEIHRIAYASVTPESLAAAAEYPDEELRAIYDAHPERFTTPERRLVDRIGFRTAEDADAARARLDAGEIDFDALAAERGLSPAEIDQGAVAAADLSDEARQAVFGAPGPGLVGPVPTPLGPSLFRINGVLAAQTTGFEDARAEIAREEALAEADQRITAETAAIDDLIAGGASLEEIASETVMELGSIELSDETTGGIADDPAFRELAAEAREGESSDLGALADGGLVTVRLEGVEPAALLPLDEVRERVVADWTAAQSLEALRALAEGHGAELAGAPDLAALAERLALQLQTTPPVTRGQTVPGAPRGLVPAIFAAAPDAVVIEPDGDGVILARIAAVEPFDPARPENAALLENLRRQFNEQAADDVLALYTAALRDTAGVSVNQELIESTLARFP